MATANYELFANFGSYIWQTQNPFGFTQDDYIVLFFKFLSEKQWQNLNQTGDIDIFRSTWMRRKTSDKILQKDWFMN